MSKVSGYLVVSKKQKQWGVSCRFTSKKPSLGPNEIAVNLEMEIPDDLFIRPQLKFSIKILKEASLQREITAEVT